MGTQGILGHPDISFVSLHIPAHREEAPPLKGEDVQILRLWLLGGLLLCLPGLGTGLPGEGKPVAEPRPAVGGVPPRPDEAVPQVLHAQSGNAGTLDSTGRDVPFEILSAPTQT